MVIAHDPRFFSKEFAGRAARIAAENGCDAYVFAGPRSTPELSFAVRALEASAGIVITASHNPPHDNGYKVYFSDGAQVVEPHASGIITRVNAIAGETFTPLPSERQGTVTTIGAEMDEAQHGAAGNTRPRWQYDSRREIFTRHLYADPRDGQRHH